jgi:hypothetical protein
MRKRLAAVPDAKSIFSIAYRKASAERERRDLVRLARIIAAAGMIEQCRSTIIAHRNQTSSVIEI